METTKDFFKKVGQFIDWLEPFVNKTVMFIDFIWNIFLIGIILCIIGFVLYGVGVSFDFVETHTTALFLLNGILLLFLIIFIHKHGYAVPENSKLLFSIGILTIFLLLLCTRIVWNILLMVLVFALAYGYEKITRNARTQKKTKKKQADE